MNDPLVRIRHSIERQVMLTDPEFARFASRLRPRSLRQKEPLLTPGELCGVEAYVVSGCLRVYHSAQNGTEHILYFAPEGSWVEDTESYVREIPGSLGIAALEATELLLLNRPDKE